MDKQRFDIITSGTVDAAAGGFIVHAAQVELKLRATPQLFYQHGWQSWSLAAWIDPQPLPVSQPEIFHPLHLDPLYAHHPSPHGNWLGAVDFDDGNILLLGALGLDSHVQLRAGNLQGWYEVARDGISHYEWFVGYGPEADVFASYTSLLAKTLGRGRTEKPYRVWCSWYSYYTNISQANLHQTFDAIGDLPFDVLQVDDGWEVKIGDWDANEKFPAGMKALADRIKATGRMAGLWLAPLIAVESSRLYQQHPDWFIQKQDGGPISAGFNWKEQLYALDTTHPAALDWLAALMRTVRSWGYDYLKLDFLYAAALPGVRHENLPREAAYRKGLAALREAMGDAYFLTCGAPILPSLGLCDAMRIGPDVAAVWESQREAFLFQNPAMPAAKNAIRTTINRLWLAPLVHTDPDVAYFRSTQTKLTPEQNRMLQALALACNFKATSDLPQSLTAQELATLREFLAASPSVERSGRYTFTLDGRAVDFSAAMPLPPKPTGLWQVAAAILSTLGSQKWVLRNLV